MFPRRCAFVALVLTSALVACGTQGSAPISSSTDDASSSMSLAQTRKAVIGQWSSIAPEIRPSVQKNPDGSMKPVYLTRAFKAMQNDRFELTLVTFADPNGKVPLARLTITGHLLWRGEHPIAPGAEKVDFIADEGYDVTPLAQGFADVLNKVASQGFAKWEVGQAQSVFGKDFAPFGLVAGKNFMEYDLVYVAHDLMFWGARNVDGRGFDTERNRPTNLQIPMVRAARAQ